MLPCEAAERVSARRIAAGDSDRTAAQLMAPIPTLAAALDGPRRGGPPRRGVEG
jgi:hypothetical protein